MQGEGRGMHPRVRILPLALTLSAQGMVEFLALLLLYVNSKSQFRLELEIH